MSVTAVRPMYWAIFGAVVLLSLLLDRAVFGGPKPRVSFREALIRSVFFVVIGLGFGGVIWLAERNLNAVFTYLLAYVVEESLSVDNLFVFLVLFTYFRINEGRQQRILFWGILGAVVMRGVFIVAGEALLSKASRVDRARVALKERERDRAVELCEQADRAGPETFKL